MSKILQHIPTCFFIWRLYYCDPLGSTEAFVSYLRCFQKATEATSALSPLFTFSAYVPISTCVFMRISMR